MGVFADFFFKFCSTNKRDWYKENFNLMQLHHQFRPRAGFRFSRGHQEPHGKIYETTPFFRLPHPSHILEFAYVNFKIASKPIDYVIIVWDGTSLISEILKGPGPLRPPLSSGPASVIFQFLRRASKCLSFHHCMVLSFACKKYQAHGTSRAHASVLMGDCMCLIEKSAKYYLLLFNSQMYHSLMT